VEEEKAPTSAAKAAIAAVKASARPAARKKA
jgi:hypothetical protein